MSHLLAVDPGIRYPAAALFVDGVLVAASRVKLKTAWAKLPMGERILTVSREIRAWYGEQIVSQPPRLDPVPALPQTPNRRAGEPKGAPHHPHPPRVGCPHRERGAAAREQETSEELPQAPVTTLVEQVDVDVARRRRQRSGWFPGRVRENRSSPSGGCAGRSSSKSSKRSTARIGRSTRSGRCASS